MPLAKDQGIRDSDVYCSLCYQNGEFTYNGDLKGFKKISYKGMREKGMSPLTASFFTFMIGFAPRWRAQQCD